MEKREVKQIIKDKAYKQSQFITDMQKTSRFIAGINNLVIDQKIFQYVRILIKFFQFPLLILFRPLFHRIEADKLSIITQYDDDLISLGSMAKAIIEDRKFPCLQFYMKSGYNQEWMAKLNLPKIPKMQIFMDFVSTIDVAIDRIHPFDVRREEINIQAIKDKIANYRVKSNVNVMEELCLQAYEGIISQKEGEIREEIRRQGSVFTLPPIGPSANSTKLSSGVISIEKGRDVVDNVESSSFLCCRSYFYLKQIIEQPQTMVQEYKNYEFPYTEYLGEILMKTICGFLNGKGGIIYIGIRQSTQTFKRVVIGHTYTEGQKEEVHKYFRKICQRISPDIVNNPLYKLQYVPLRESEGKCMFIQGRYILRLKIMKGQQKELYSFLDYDRNDCFAFRTANEVLVRRIGQEILETYRQRLQQREEPTFSHHDGPCRIPEQGKFLYDNAKGTTWTAATQVSRPYLKQKQSASEQLNDTVKFQSVKSSANTVIFFVVDAKDENLFSQYFLERYKQHIAVMVYFPAQKKQIEQILRFNNIEITRASTVMEFEEALYYRVIEILKENKILFASIGSNRSVQFSKVAEVMEAMSLLNSLGIRYSFRQ